MVERLCRLFYEKLAGWRHRNDTDHRPLAEKLVQEGFLKAMDSEDALEGLEQNQFIIASSC